MASPNIEASATYKKNNFTNSGNTAAGGAVNWIDALVNLRGGGPTPTPPTPTTPAPGPVTPDPVTPTPGPGTPDPVTPTPGPVTPTPTAPGQALSKKSFSGETVKVNVQGQVSLGDDVLKFDFKAPTQKDIDGLMGLIAPGQLVFVLFCKSDFSAAAPAASMVTPLSPALSPVASSPHSCDMDGWQTDGASAHEAL